MVKAELEECIAPCQDLAYQKFCAQICEFVPCCAEVCKDRSTQRMPSLSGGLIVQAFDLGKTITQKGMAKFRARGTCNYPCVKPGDILHVDTRDSKQIQIGDIVVYRRSRLLFSHRAVDKGEKNGLCYVVTQSDGAEEADAPVFDEDILGIVTSIERKGKLLSPARSTYTLANRVFIRFRLKCYLLKQLLLRSAVSSMVGIQQFRIYRKMATFVFSRLNRKMDFSIRKSLNSRALAHFYRMLSPQEFADLDPFDRKNMNSEWTFVLSANSCVAASLSLVFRPEYCPSSGCWLSEIKRKTRYRGTNLEGKLFDRASILIKQMGISKIFAGYSKGDSLRKITLKDLGFREVIANEYTLSTGRSDSPIMIMEKEI